MRECHGAEARTFDDTDNCIVLRDWAPMIQECHRNVLDEFVISGDEKDTAEGTTSNEAVNGRRRRIPEQQDDTSC